MEADESAIEEEPIQFSIRTMMLWTLVVAVMMLCLRFSGAPGPRLEIIYAYILTIAWLYALGEETAPLAYGWLTLGWLLSIVLSVHSLKSSISGFCYPPPAEEFAIQLWSALFWDSAVPVAFTPLVLCELRRHRPPDMPWKTWLALSVLLALVNIAVLAISVPILYVFSTLGRL